MDSIRPLCPKLRVLLTLILNFFSNKGIFVCRAVRTFEPTGQRIESRLSVVDSRKHQSAKHEHNPQHNDSRRPAAVRSQRPTTHDGTTKGERAIIQVVQRLSLPRATNSFGQLVRVRFTSIPDSADATTITQLV